MKVRLALAAALAIPLGLSAMPTAVEYLPSKISLTKAVKLGDGSVLPAGPYDVQIHYKGFGNTAELQFFQNRVFKGRANAEARGFPATAPGGTAGAAHTVKLQKDSSEGKVFPKMEEPVANKKISPAGAPAAFSWENLGFREGQKGIVAPGPPGMLKLSFDSANSAAGSR